MNKEFVSETLFVTDLDGTLFSTAPELSKDAVAHIVKLVDSGVRLTYSTARTYRTVEKILSAVPAPIPVSLMNGVMIRDIKKGLNHVVHPIPQDAAEHAAAVFRERGVMPLVYRVKSGEMQTYYSEPQNSYVESFIRERREKFGKPFIKTDEETLLGTDGDDGGEIIYFCAMTDEGAANGLNTKLSAIDGVVSTSYKDNYSDVRYVEVFSPLATKKNAVLFLKKLTGASRLVTFGDNLNDLSMFGVSDMCFAPAGAAEGAAAAADGLIPSPAECGVTRKIAELCGISLS